MADYHVRHRRISSGSDDYEDESLDPRIQGELEKLNKASEEINRLELELDDARASFRQTLSESTQKLDVLAKKLGSCVEKARPYYDARVKAKEAHLETQRAALRFERACSMHEAAKEMVQLAEQGYMRRELPSDPAWQEMLNHATMKVNEAEKERNESEQEHQRTMIRFKVSEDQVQILQKDLKRTITKSKPYFEMKARFNQIMEEHKHKVSVLEEDVSSAKSLYATALRSLEAISEEIHRQRLERRQQQQLGVRGAGVGAECPLPPPSWEKGVVAMDGTDAGRVPSLDPLGVIKVSSTVSFGGSAARQRSRNLSGESAHGKVGEEEDKPASDPATQGHDLAENMSALGESGEQVRGDGESADQTEMNVSGQHDAECVVMVGSPVSDSPSPKDKVLIPGDPLGVIPPTYTSSRSARSAKVPHPSPSTGTLISHPAFSGTGSLSAAGHKSQIVHPAVSQASDVQLGATGGGPRTKSASRVPEGFTPSSPALLYSSPQQARRQSYRRAVEASQRDPRDLEQEVEGSYSQHSEGRSHEVFEAESRQRSYSSPVHPSDTLPRSPPRAVPAKHSSAVQEALADGRRHGSAPERSVTALCQRFEEGTSDSGAAQQRNKLQGLILRIDPTMDPLRHFEPGARNRPGHDSRAQPSAPANSSANTTTTTSPPSATGQREREVVCPPSAQGLSKSQMTSDTDISGNAETSVSKPIIRSASTVSATGSERSETEFSEVESVSATQSPTKPRSRLLNVPGSVDTVEDSSDTESLASTGPMLDDEQVEFLTMDFSDMAMEDRDGEDCANTSSTLPSRLKRNSWSRMSLPSRLSHLEGFIIHAKRLSGEFDLPADECVESPQEDEGDVTLVSPSLDGVMEGSIVDDDVDSMDKESKCQEQGEVADDGETINVRL